MELCDILVGNDNQEYIGKYEKESNALNIKIYNYPCDFLDNKKEIEYESITVKDFDNKVFIYSPTFVNTGVCIGLSSYAKYQTDFYFETNKVEAISDLNKDIKINAIKFSHSMLRNYFYNPSLDFVRTDEYYQYKIKTKADKKEIEINKNNISKLVFSGDCYFQDKNRHHKIEIETKNFITIYLIKEINYGEVLSYIQEMNVYLNAYFPIGLKTCETYVVTNNGNSFKLVHRLLEINDYNRFPDKFIKDSFFDFMKKMYTNTDYRISANKNNFLPLEFKIPTSLEDKFLFYFRYINLFVGDKLAKKIGKKPNTFDCLSDFRLNNNDLFNKSDLGNKYFINEINSLRNHYIHEGYYLTNNKFDVTEHKKTLLYSKTIDYNWLYRITEALKRGVYRMMYKEVLNFDIDEKILFEVIKQL